MYDRLAAGDNHFVARPVRIFYEKNRRLFMSVSGFPTWPLVMSPRAAINAVPAARHCVDARTPR